MVAVSSQPIRLTTPSSWLCVVGGNMSLAPVAVVWQIDGRRSVKIDRRLHDFYHEHDEQHPHGRDNNRDARKRITGARTERARSARSAKGACQPAALAALD